MNNVQASECIKDTGCQRFRELLYLYNAAELDMARKTDVALHLLVCPACRSAQREHRMLTLALAASLMNRPTFYFSREA